MSLRPWFLIAGMLGFSGAALAQQTDYSAGKTPAQLFSSDCAACHSTARGLAKGRDQRSLAGFLREHYTTKQETASTLAAFLAGAPAGPAAQTRNPGEPRGAQPGGRTPRPPGPIEGADDAAIMTPEPGAAAERRQQRTQPPAREAAKPPPRGKKAEEAARAAEEAEKEAQRAKVRGYATVGDEARPIRASAPAAPPPASPAPPAASEAPKPPADTAAPADKPSEPARTETPATPPSGETKSPPG
jgi:hypothetical protein